MNTGNLPEIFLGESSPETTELVHMLLGRKFKLSIMDEFSDVLAMVRSNRPKLVMVNIESLINWESAVELFESVPTLVYGDKMPLNDRLRCYQSGARRVMALPANSAHQAGLWVRNIFGYNSESDNILAPAITEGRIDTNTLPELFFNAMMDKKSIIIKTHYEGWQGSVTIFEGQIVRVSGTEDSSGETLGKMLKLTSGTFRAKPLESMTGVLKSDISLWQALVQSQFDRQKGSTFTGSESALDLGFVRQKLFPKDRQQGGLLIFGPPEMGRSDLIRTIAGVQRGEFQSVQMLEFTRIAVGEGKNLTIIGISIEENILPVLQKISGGMLASIFLIDVADRKRAEFTGYLLKQVIQIYHLPVVVGIRNHHLLGKKESQNLHEFVGLPEDVAIAVLNGDHLGDLKLLLETLPTTVLEEADD